MKTSVIIGAMATAALAQDLTGFENLPACGQTCVTNMVNKAEDLGCSSNDIACMCLNADFSYGVRDCTDESCGDSKAAGDTQAWAVDICAREGVAVTSKMDDIGASTASDATLTEATATGDISVTSSVTTTITSSGSVITSVISTVVPIQTSSTGRTTTRSSDDPEETGNGDDDNNNDDGGNGGDNNNNNDDAPDAGVMTAVPLGFMAVAGLVALLF